VSLIAGITGTVAGKTLDKILILVGGITFAIAVPLTTLGQVTLGETTTLHTHLQVREDDLALFGFSTTEERDLFVRLIGVSGVGTRIGMAMLSTHSVESIYHSIIHEDLDKLSRTPGVGKKLAQRLVLELKIPLEKALAGLPLNVDGEGFESGQISTGITREGDIIEALTGLGYSANEVQGSLRKNPDILKLSLDEAIVKTLRILAR
jgi:Holliday junction DNA helicase RuvA